MKFDLMMVLKFLVILPKFLFISNKIDYIVISSPVSVHYLAVHGLAVLLTISFDESC